MNLLLRKIRHRPTRPASSSPPSSLPPSPSPSRHRRYKNFPLPGKIFINVVIPPGTVSAKRDVAAIIVGSFEKWFARRSERFAAAETFTRVEGEGEVRQVIERLLEAFIHFTLHEWYVIISDTKSDNGNIAFEKIGVFAMLRDSYNRNLSSDRNNIPSVESYGLCRTRTQVEVQVPKDVNFVS